MSGTLMVNVGGRHFHVYPNDEIDQVTYLVQEGDETVTVIGLNENAEWEGANDFDPGMIRKIGEAIECKC